MFDLKAIFLNATSPNTQIRTEAESILLGFVKRPGFVVELTTFFKDPDARIKLIASIFFKNFTISEWSEHEFQSQRNIILQNIVVLIASADNAITGNLLQLLTFILTNEDINKWAVIMNPCSALLQDQSNMAGIKAGLRIISCIAENDLIKYDSTAAENIIGPIYPFLVKLLQHLTNHREYESCKIIMKMITNLQDPYVAPEYLRSVNNISEVYTIAANVINIEDNTHDYFLYSFKKWSIKFYTRIFAKFSRNEPEETSLAAKSYVTDQNNCTSIFNIIVNAIKREISTGFEFDNSQDQILSACVAYLNAMVSEKKVNCNYMRTEVLFIIFHFILPLLFFNQEDEYRFESEPHDYIRDKYNYYAVDLRGFVTLFFSGIMKKFRNDKQLKETIFSGFIKTFEEYSANPSLENAKKKYGALLLVTSSSKFILMNHNEFISKYILPDFSSPHKFLCSQACYSLQNFKDENISCEIMNLIFDGVVVNLQSKDNITRAEALFAVQFLLNSEAIYNRLKSIVPVIIQNLIEIQGKNQIEAFNDLLKNITLEFPDEICIYFPQLVDLFSKTIIAGINEINEDNICLYASYIDTIIYLLDALKNKQDLVFNLFCISAEMMYAIFTSQTTDLVSNAIELFSEIVVAFGKVEDSMFNMFKIVMQLSDDQKLESASYMVSLLDNFISFGQDKVLTEINPILNFIKIMCKPEDDCYMEDEYQYGCQVIDSLILNHNNRVCELIPFFIDCIMTHYPEIDQSTCYIIFHLDTLMNCFIINFAHTWSILASRNHIQTFFDDLFAARNKFVRVFDKKLVIIFSCILLKTDEKLLESVEINKFKKFFIANVETLPEAINKRTKMIEKNDNDEDDDDEVENEDDYDEYYDELRENIYFFSPIDNINVFLILQNALNAIVSGSFGMKVINCMNSKEKNLMSEYI